MKRRYKLVFTVLPERRLLNLHQPLFCSDWMCPSMVRKPMLHLTASDSRPGQHSPSSLADQPATKAPVFARRNGQRNAQTLLERSCGTLASTA